MLNQKKIKSVEKLNKFKATTKKILDSVHSVNEIKEIKLTLTVMNI